jgi:uncharacterized membrane protein YesL
MKVNMGGLDRGLRIVLAVVVALLIGTGTLSGTWAIVLGIVAVVFLVTSLIGMCPLYALLGTSTCKVKQNE